MGSGSIRLGPRQVLGGVVSMVAIATAHPAPEGASGSPQVAPLHGEGSRGDCPGSRSWEISGNHTAVCLPLLLPGDVGSGAARTFPLLG